MKCLVVKGKLDGGMRVLPWDSQKITFSGGIVKRDAGPEECGTRRIVGTIQDKRRKCLPVGI